MNPNGPLFISAALRQVKGFSSEWWQLMKTPTWFYNYWLSQQHEDGVFFVYDEDDLEDIVDLLPDAIDLGIEKEICNMKTQFEHFIQLSEAEAGNKKLSSSALKESPGSVQFI
ncbi:protein EARLY RESPONSIVE TO DEHYDRATION 15-like [Apium graveolens]|uniref:protein EARLY RESPONSIVE TO DEHYDRATION 15-like n=1 Tax=Apium graveolens TaxID=4045 RepID=UPI003D7BDDC4